MIVWNRTLELRINRQQLYPQLGEILRVEVRLPDELSILNLV